MFRPGNTKGGSITVPLTSCLTSLETAVWQLTIFDFYLQNWLIQTSQTGGQQYCDTSPFSIPCLDQIQPQSVPTRTRPFAGDSKRALRRLSLCRASPTSNVATPIYRLITLFCVEFGSINSARFHFLSVKATLIEFDIINKVSSQLLTWGLYYKTITIINDDHKLRHNLEHHLGS
jgi:hypothetical protein